MMINYFYKLSLFLLIILQSCSFDDDEIVYEETLVVFANITADFPVIDTVLVSRTSTIGESLPSDSLWEENAEVTLVDSSGEKLQFLNFGKGRYFPVNDSSSPEELAYYLSFIIRGGEEYQLIVTTDKGDSVTARTVVPSSMIINPVESATYECPDGETLLTNEVDVNNLQDFSPGEILTMLGNSDLFIQSNNINVDTVMYRFGDCFTQSFASYPFFNVSFENDSYQTIKILTYALEADEMGLEPLDSLSNTVDSISGEGFFDYNYNQIRDSVLVNLIYDTTLGFRIWKGQYPRDENSNPYRINPWQWNIEESPQPIMWLYFDYYGLQLMTFQATSESYFDYFSGDPVGQNIYLLPDSNIEGAKGVFYSSASTSFLVYVKRDE
jgi:hypothetical protein